MLDLVRPTCVIIVPSSGALLKQALRLKEFHESHDGMRVNIVAADQPHK